MSLWCPYQPHVEDLAQDCGNSCELAMELLQFCTKQHASIILDMYKGYVMALLGTGFTSNLIQCS